MPKAKVGDHVVLAGNEEEGWPEECGWVLDTWHDDGLTIGLCAVADGTLEAGDDGLREVTQDQVKEVTRA